MKKKIYLNGRFLTQPLTGVQRTAYELVKALDELMEEGLIDKQQYDYCLIHPGKILNPISLKNIRIIEKGFFKGNLWEQFELPFYTSGGLLISMCTISTLFKRKQMVIVHDASFAVNPHFFPFIFRTWYKAAIPALGKIAARIITVSNFSKKELVRHTGIRDAKISVIYNAADHIDNYEDADEQFKSKVNSSKPYCLAVSSLGANKNFKGLNEAFSKAQIPGHSILVAGAEVKTLKAERATSSSAWYLGYVTNSQLKYLYSNASLFVFPSFYEGFGIPPLEAMRSGCPVIASKTSSLPEVLGDACEYIDPSDTDDIAAKIQTLLNDRTKQQTLREKGFQQAKKYSWRRSAMQLQELINEYSGKN